VTIFRSIFFSLTRGTNEIFLARQQKDVQRMTHNVHLLRSLGWNTFYSHDDADSGLFSLFNYPASTMSCVAPALMSAIVSVVVVVVIVVAVFFSLSLAGTTESTWCDNELSSRTRFLGRNRKYRQTIMAICRKNRCVLYGIVLLGILLYTSIEN